MQIIKLEQEMMMGEKPKVNPVNGTYVAGGSIRRWFTGEKQLSDIDVFGSDEGIKEFIKFHKLSSPLSQTNNADSYFASGRTIQIIKLKFDSMEDAIDHFDFVHCQFAWGGEDNIIASLKGILCSLRKKLMVHKIQEGYELDSLRRAFKYQRQGYTPCVGCLHEIASSFRDKTAEQLKEQLEISPGGGERNVRFD